MTPALLSFFGPPLTLAAPFKICSKCKAHISREQWNALPCIGLQDDGDGGYLELRNHECGSTLAIATDAP